MSVFHIFSFLNKYKNLLPTFQESMKAIKTHPNVYSPRQQNTVKEKKVHPLPKANTKEGKNVRGSGKITTNNDKITQCKNQKAGNFNYSSVSTQDLQTKNTKIPNSKAEDSKISQPSIQKTSTKNLSQKGQNVQEHENPSFLSHSKRSGKQSQNSRVLSFKDLQYNFFDQIQQLEKKVIEYQDIMVNKEKIISQLKNQKQKLSIEINKVKQEEQKNKRAIREKILKFNQEGEENRKLKQKITELEKQIIQLKSSKLNNSFTEDQRILEEQKNIVVYPGDEMDLNESYIFKTIESKISSDETINSNEDMMKKIKIESQRTSSEIKNHFNKLLEQKDKKIQEQAEIINALKEKIDLLASREEKKQKITQCPPSKVPPFSKKKQQRMKSIDNIMNLASKRIGLHQDLLQTLDMKK